MSKSKVLPPKNFRPAGVVEWVRYSPDPPPFINRRRRYGRRAEGIRYEKKAQDMMAERYEGFYVGSPWFVFQEVGAPRPRWCQPDGLLFMPFTGQITIVEYKLQHTADAWWQLRWLYLPVIARAFPGNLWRFGMCEVVKWYDPATVFPERVKLRSEVIETIPNEIGVHIWKP